MSWKPLLLSAIAGAHLPPLLVSTTFADEAYTIHLTDLVHIWSESLDRKAIVHRSREEGTSIDPSSGDQFQIFFEKIKLGFNRAEGTITTLTVLNSDAARPGLVLTLTVKLPGGLAPLVWPIQLSAAPQALLTSKLIIPLMQAQHARTLEFESLMEVVREKDHVIQKVVDKLEASGTEFGEVFPQAAGKAGRKVDRKKAEDRVRGMAVFDINAWRSGLDQGVLQNMVQLIGKIFTGNMAAVTHGQANAQDLGEDWWESIKGITINLMDGKFSTNGLSKVNSSALVAPPEDTIEKDAFQVQATPPQLTSLSMRQASSPVDSEDIDIQSQGSHIPDSFPLPEYLVSGPPPRLKRFTTPGGNKAFHTSSIPARAGDASSVGEAASRVELTHKVRTSSPPPSQAVKRTKKTLGKIGGQREKVIPLVESEIQSGTLPQRDLEPVNPKKAKLGQIGGKKTKEVAAAGSSRLRQDNTPAASHGEEKPGSYTPEDIDEIQARASIKQERDMTVVPSSQETETERANRKRDALKRDLEQKAKVPAKKKRKF